MAKKLSEVFGKLIRDQRTKNGLSQEELATRSGFHRTYIGMIERGEKNITLNNALKLANALDLSISDLLKNI